MVEIVQVSSASELQAVVMDSSYDMTLKIMHLNPYESKQQCKKPEGSH